MWAQIESMQKALAMPEVAPSRPASSSGAGFDSCDETIIRISAKSLVAMDSVKEAMAGRCEASGIRPEQYELKGAQLSKRFTLQFKGEAGTAARRATKVNNSLRNAAGEWEVVHVQTPAGGSERLFISLDKLRSRIRKEQALTQLKTIITDAHPSLNVMPVKRDGIIAYKWQPMATVSLDGEGKPTISWNTDVSSEAGIDHAEIERKFHEKDGLRRAARGQSSF